MMSSIQGTGSLGGIDSFPPPPQSRPLTDDQKSLVQSTLAEHDAENLTADDAREILDTFRQAGIRPGRELRQAIQDAGFDEKKLLDLARPEGAPEGGPQGGPQGPRSNHGARSSSNVDLSALQSLQSILNNYDLSSISDEDETNLLSQLNSAGLVRTGYMIDLSA